MMECRHACKIMERFFEVTNCVKQGCVRLRSHKNIRYTVFAIRMPVHIGSTFFQCVPFVSMKNVNSSGEEDFA